MPVAPSGPPSALTLAAYVAPCVPFATLGAPLLVYLPEFYANYVGLSLTGVGMTFLVVRLIDVALDPLIGALIDRTRSPRGRFRAWLAGGVPLLLASAYLIFMARPGAGVAYLAAGLLALYAGQSICVLSHTAWGSVLGASYHDRSLVYAWWQGANIVGLVLVLTLPPLMAALAPGHPAAGIRAMGWFTIVLAPLAVAAAWWRVPEPGGRLAASPTTTASGEWRDLVGIMRRPAVSRILVADLALGVAAGIAGSLFLFFFRDARGYATTEATALLLVYVLAGLAGAPLWMSLARKLGKHRALRAAAIYHAATQLAVLMLPARTMILAVPAVFVAGLSFAAAPFLLRAMIADAADEARLDTGLDRTGFLYGLVNSTSKIGHGLAVGIGYVGLDAVGFATGQGAVNTQAALGGLAALFAAAPAFCALVAAAAIRGYRIDAARHAAVRHALADRQAGA